MEQTICWYQSNIYLPNPYYPLPTLKIFTMAVQTGIVPLVGTIGNINFYKREGQYLARGKVGVTADRIAIDPKFARSRENAAEFGTASRAGKLLRTAFKSLLRAGGTDMPMVRRLASKMVSVIQGDPSSARGMRKVINGQPRLLEGFEFNEPGQLSTTFRAQYAVDISRETGELRISIPSFVPGDMVVAPPSATHFKLISAGAAIDFENKASETGVHESAELPLNNEETAEMVLINKVSANSRHPFFLVLGIEFYQQVNAWMYPLNDRAFNALAIVKVAAM